jgi:hypothetical protein
MMRRFDMRLPAAVHFADATIGDLLTETQNVSARGIFFYLDRELSPGCQFDVTLVDDPLPGSRIGVAALIEQYEFLGAKPTVNS